MLGDLEETVANNLWIDSIIKAMEKECRVLNIDFIKSDKFQIVVSNKKLYAKDELVKYLTKRCPKCIVWDKLLAK